MIDFSLWSRGQGGVATEEFASRSACDGVWGWDTQAGRQPSPLRLPRGICTGERRLSHGGSCSGYAAEQSRTDRPLPPLTDHPGRLFAISSGLCGLTKVLQLIWPLVSCDINVYTETIPALSLWVRMKNLPSSSVRSALLNFSTPTV